MLLVPVPMQVVVALLSLPLALLHGDQPPLTIATIAPSTPRERGGERPPRVEAAVSLSVGDPPRSAGSHPDGT
jgi:hypothetical protein